MWLFLYGSWNQTVIGLNTYSTVLRFPTAFMASAGLLCAASMTLIVAVNLLRILTGEELPYATLMYVWCNKRAPGSVVRNPRTDRSFDSFSASLGAS